MKTCKSDFTLEPKDIRKQFLLRKGTANKLANLSKALGISENEIINRMIESATKENS